MAITCRAWALPGAAQDGQSWVALLHRRQDWLPGRKPMTPLPEYGLRGPGGLACREGLWGL